MSPKREDVQLAVPSMQQESELVPSIIASNQSQVRTVGLA